MAATYYSCNPPMCIKAATFHGHVQQKLLTSVWWCRISMSTSFTARRSSVFSKQPLLSSSSSAAQALVSCTSCCIGGIVGQQIRLLQKAVKSYSSALILTFSCKLLITCPDHRPPHEVWSPEMNTNTVCCIRQSVTRSAALAITWTPATKRSALPNAASKHLMLC